MYDIAIIGAGVIGTAIARELSRYDLKVIILDKEEDACVGASKANSGIVHAGFAQAEGTLMSKFNVLGNKMFDDLCGELSVPFIRNGSFVVAFDDEQLAHVQRLKERGINNGVTGLSILTKDELLNREKAISPQALGALYAETGGVADPMILTLALLENAAMNGVDYVFGFNVSEITKNENGYVIKSNNSEVRSQFVINAAGVYSDSIHNMAAAPAFKITPVCGQYFLLDKTEAGIVSATVFPCPTKMGKGVLVSPTAHGNVIVGPSSDYISDKEDVSTADETLESVRKNAQLLVPKVSTRNTIRNFSGLRAESDTGDFIVQEVADAPKFIDVAGIKSPGLTAAPAIAVHVVSLIGEKGLPLNKKKDFNPIIKRKLFYEMEADEQAALIKKDPQYGRIICRCENITEGDIVAAIKRKGGATTMDGVKRRCRAGMGRCQGGFCGPRVQHILARELERPLEEIVLEKKSSYILTGRTK
ncbi:MAG: NAD(P)/FAD-dependent oxidoreductase [Treponema sp.]|jgi:glycerol-3-phosphate dehydrogenase|nr:NAD(P)/FAD-dependent oxidoreductase [Treponema sp.]